MSANISKLNELEEKIEYKFKNIKFLAQALTHSSYANEMKLNKVKDYERIEFLGDAVLELVSSEFLFKKHKDMLEGEMTKLRATLVCEPSLAYCARNLNLGDYLKLGKGESMTGGADRDSILADCVEAIIGAIYLDSDLDEAKKFIFKYVLNDIEERHLFSDSKTSLQEILQAKGKHTISYNLIKEEGPEHNKQFFVEVLIDDKSVGIGRGKNKKNAEQLAAKEAIIAIKNKKVVL